jgi:hypothetical protein
VHLPAALVARRLPPPRDPRVILDMVKVLVGAGATPASAVRAATVLEQGGSYDQASAELVIAEGTRPAPLLISEFEWLSLAHAIETGGDHPLDELIENRAVVVV